MTSVHIGILIVNGIFIFNIFHQNTLGIFLRPTFDFKCNPYIIHLQSITVLKYRCCDCGNHKHVYAGRTQNSRKFLQEK